MRHIDRLDIPEILRNNQERWEAGYRIKLTANPTARPDSPKYAHKDIRRQLLSMSHSKCFYCEGDLKNEPKEVDHYIEVACDRTKAYEWTNLYMACHNCNDKIPHSKIPVTDALDPCTDSDATIKENITFDGPIIQAVPGSAKGLKTITKFRLDTELLDAKREKLIIVIYNKILEILKKMIDEGRKDLTDEERNDLLQYTLPTSRFSLMSEIFIKKNLPRFFP